MCNEKFFKERNPEINPSERSTLLTHVPPRSREPRVHPGRPANGKSIKSKLACTAGAAVVLILIALMAFISNSRLGQLLLVLIY